MIHRADYRRILVEEAVRCGAEVRFGSHVSNVDCRAPSVQLSDGTGILADVVIGADGMDKSSVRMEVVQH